MGKKSLVICDTKVNYHESFITLICFGYCHQC